MKKLTVLNKSIITALCVALCVVLPMALHAIPKGGVLFSPMHLPVLLCGLVCGALWDLCAVFWVHWCPACLPACLRSAICPL